MTERATAVDRVFREEFGRAVALLARVLGDVGYAEDAVQDAYLEALRRWPADGVPANPRAWIVAVARNRAIDRLRRDRVLADRTAQLARRAEDEMTAYDETRDDDSIPDERLRLIFTCCHPALAPQTQVALTLRMVAGLTVPEIARALLSNEPAVAQRLVRAKHKLRVAGVPVRVPPDEALPARLEVALAVVYLIFNEGYVATAGDRLQRDDLAAEAIRLGRLLADLMPDEADVLGLLALMLLHHARRETRTDAGGEPVLLAEQDRGRWDRAMIEEGSVLTRRALRMRRPPPVYAVQAAIAAVHATAASADDTDWAEIAALYALLGELRAVTGGRAEPGGGGVDGQRAGGRAGAGRPAGRHRQPGRQPSAARRPGRHAGPAGPPRRGRRRLPAGDRAGRERRRAAAARPQAARAVSHGYQPALVWMPITRPCGTSASASRPPKAPRWKISGWPPEPSKSITSPTTRSWSPASCTP